METFLFAVGTLAPLLLILVVVHEMGHFATARAIGVKVLEFGWGFPPYAGGTISYIEMIGLREFVAEADRLADTYGERFQVPDSLRKMAENGDTFYGIAEADEQRSAP